MLQLCKVKLIKEHLRSSFSSIGIFSTVSENLVLIILSLSKIKQSVIVLRASKSIWADYFEKS